MDPYKDINLNFNVSLSQSKPFSKVGRKTPKCPQIPQPFVNKESLCKMHTTQVYCWIKVYRPDDKQIWRSALSSKNSLF